MAFLIFSSIEKQKFTTFFSDHRDKLTVLKKVGEAYKNVIVKQNSGIIGLTEERIKIQIWFKRNPATGELIINSAYPIRE